MRKHFLQKHVKHTEHDPRFRTQVVKPILESFRGVYCILDVYLFLSLEQYDLRYSKSLFTKYVETH